LTFAVRGLAALALLLASGCSHGSTNLAGHWRGIRAEGVRSDVVDATNAYATRMRVDVKGDTITLTSGKDVRVDHYSVLHEDATKTVIVTESDGEADPQTFTIVDAKTMKWSVTPGAVVVFSKEVAPP
jgi:hypothetical protein